MFNIGLAVIAAVAGIGIGILYNILVIKNYPENQRKSSYVVTVILFLFISLVLFGIFSVNKGAIKAINEYAAKIEQSAKTNFPDNVLVKDGFNLDELNNDVSKLNTVVDNVKELLPSHADLGIDKTLYDFAVSIAMKEVQKNISIVNKTVNAASSFTDENNSLTISSILNHVQKSLTKLVNIISLVLAAIFALILLIYVIKSLLRAKREKQA